MLSTNTWNQLVGWLVGFCVLRRINFFGSFNTELSHFDKFQTIQFSISIIFVYTHLNAKSVVFQTIQFSISTQFSSIRPTDRTLSSATNSSQSGPGSDGSEGVLHIPQISRITGVSSLDCLVSYSSVEIQSVYSTAPADWTIGTI